MKTYQAFVEWCQCQCGCKPVFGIARLFEVTKDPFKLAVDGMPNAAWVWMCNIELRGKTVFVKAALVAPKFAYLRSLKAAARLLGAEWLQWERLDEHTGKLEEETFPCFPSAAADEGPEVSAQEYRLSEIQTSESKTEIKS